MIAKLSDELELTHVFVHANEAINSKMNTIMWMHPDRYEKIVPLIGGFHTLLVNLKILYKKYGCFGLQDWWVDASAIAEGSVTQAIEGRHCARGIRLHKQSFCALMRWKILQNRPLDVELIVSIANLRLETTANTLEALIEMESSQLYCINMCSTKDGTQCRMMIEYLKDVSKLLALIYAVRERSIELHLVAERALLPKCFAFDHVNYCRYLSVQHVNLHAKRIQKKDEWEDFLHNGFGGSLSGERFSTIHGDLITETTINREVIVRGGPMQGGYRYIRENNRCIYQN